MLDLVVPLFMDKEDMSRVLYNAGGVIDDGRAWCVLRDRERPKPFSEAEDDGVDERLVRMCGEEGFQAVDVDWRDELEEVWMKTNRRASYRIVQFIGRSRG